MGGSRPQTLDPQTLSLNPQTSNLTMHPVVVLRGAPCEVHVYGSGTDFNGVLQSTLDVRKFTLHVQSARLLLPASELALRGHALHSPGPVQFL